MQLVDFQPIFFEVGENGSGEGTKLGGFFRERWTPKKDIQGFASILFEIVISGPANFESSIPMGIPAFVSKIIESGLYGTCETKYSFNNIFKILKSNDFRIDDAVDSAEVFAFVSWIESAEQSEK
jgi:hypothetical protein